MSAAGAACLDKAGLDAASLQNELAHLVFSSNTQSC